jgi:ADP-heptose:LPS heptosyltransferase
LQYSILIIKLGALGDVLRTTFLLKELKNKYKDCKISWLTAEKAKELLANNPLIDKIYAIDDKEIIPEYFDLVLSLDEEKETADIASKLKKNKIIGVYSEKGMINYTPDSETWFGMGLLRPKEKGGIEEADKLKKQNKKTYQEIIAKIAGTEYNKEPYTLNLTKEETLFGEKFAKKNGIIRGELVIGLNTGAGKRWPAKMWSEKKTAELADMLSENLKAKIIVFGGKDENERNEKIRKLAKAKIIDAGSNNSLRQFSSLVNLCKIMVVTDTLAMHIALSLGKKVVVLMGPTSLHEIETYGLGKKLYADSKCLCCYKKECNYGEECCTEKISVKQVYESIVEALK